MLKQITTEGIEKRLADENLYIFQGVSNKGPGEMTIEVFQMNKFGSPCEIMKALESDSVMLFEEVKDGDSKQISGLSVL